MAGKGLNSRARPLLRNLVSWPPLQYRDLRYLWLSGLLNSVGMMGGQVVLGWVILELTDSPFIVGVALGLRMAPFFFLGILAGTIADMVDRGKLMRLVNLGNAAANAAIGVLMLLGLAEVWHILALTFVGGGMMALYQTARQSIAYDIAGPRNLVSSLAFISLGMRLGGIAGSLSLGFILGRLGGDIAYLTMAAAYIVSTLALLPIRSTGQMTSDSRHPVWQSLKEFGAEVRRNTDLRTLAILVAVAEVIGFSYMALLPSLAKDVLNIGAEGLGIMTAFSAGGGMLSIVLLSVLGESRRKGLTWLIALVIFGGGLVALGFASTFYMAILAVIVISGMTALSDIFSQSLMQLVVPNEFRGRAMGAWTFAIGMLPLGNLQIGALASAFGVTFALVAHGTGLAAIAALGLLLLSRLRKL